VTFATGVHDTLKEFVVIRLDDSTGATGSGIRVVTDIGLLVTDPAIFVAVITITY
jgi:hypothetical protein